MEIINVSDRELTEKEIASIHHFRSVTDGVSFACLREGVMMMLLSESSKDVEKLKECTYDQMDEVLSQMPDFDGWELKDGCVMVAMNGGVCAISDEPCVADIRSYLPLRNECLEACEDGEILAIVYDEDYVYE